jgi:tungstate transport system ATP-binding protein
LADSGTTLIFSSHNLGQVKRLASRVVYLEYGRVVADLPTNDFFNGPLRPNTFSKENSDEP